MITTFKNLPFIDFSIAENRAKFQDAIKEVQNKIVDSPYLIEKLLPPVTKSKTQKPNSFLENTLPENTSILFSRTELSSTADAEQAVIALLSYQESWRKADVAQRCSILLNAADIMEERRYELAALICHEAAKPWVEADGDVAEAIDFCRYYAEEAKNLFIPRSMGNFQGELNTYLYEPRGISLVISPWNFPLAIPCGMFAASIVCGNCTILKPAEQTPVIAEVLFKIFIEAGLPPESACFLPGLGEEVGAYLANHPKVSTIVFTGSKEVGLSLVKSGAETSAESVHVTRVLAEMGGKNAIVVDSDADLDQAIKGVLYSAFGFQGQKCSACSRVYVVSKDLFQRFCERFSNALNDLKIGKATEPGTFIGPVIDESAFRRISKCVTAAKKRCHLLAEGEVPESLAGTGHFIGPAAFAIDDPLDPLLTDEIFGPVLGLQCVPDFEEGIRRALDSPYRLTGGIFSRNPKNINYAITEFAVGNLYINRTCTGALVYRQPFGGAHMSGVGAKAGGPDYLLQFVVPRTISENTVRQGFAPSE